MFNALVVIYVLSALLAMLLAAASWDRRRLPGAMPFTLLMIAVFLWCLFYALEGLAAAFADKVFWAMCQYIGIVAEGVLWFTFAYKYTRRTFHWPARYYWLWLLPVIGLALVFTNPYHGLAWTSITPAPGDSGLLVYEHGPVVLGIVIYDYALAVAGVVLLLKMAARRQGLTRGQAAALAAGTLLPVAVNIVYLLKVIPVPGLDVTPLAFLMTGVIYVIVIFRFRLFDVVPVARDRLVETLQDAVVVLDERGWLMYLNPAARALVGASDSDTGRPWNTVASRWPGLAALPVVGDGDFTETVFSADGARIMDVRSTVIRNRGRVSGRVLVLHDVTQPLRIQEQLQQTLDSEKKLREDLQGEIRNRSEYTRALIHELRTPLTAMVASTELLGDLVKEGPAGALVENVGRASANLNQRIGELVEMARGEIGLIKLNPAPFDLAVLLKQIIDEMTPLAARQNITLIFDLPARLPLAWGEGPRVRQVVVNLLSNAFKFTAVGGVVRVSLQAAGEKMLRVNVQDSGRGMNEEELKFLFDPYHRKQRDKERLGGLGIGLALSKMFVELHGGTIVAESIEGKGTTIRFTVPVAPEELQVPTV